MIEPGEYRGEILEASMSESKDGKPYALIKARPDGMNESVAWFGSFSDTIIKSGNNTGKRVGDMTAKTIGSFGVDDFSKIESIEGKKCIFGVKHEPDEKNGGQLRAKVSYIRPPGNSKPLSAAGAAGLNKFRAAAIEAARSAPKDDVRAPANGASGGTGYDDHDYGAGGDEIPF